MARGQPDGKNIHAAGERDHGIVSQSQQDQTDAAEVAKAVPDGNRKKKMQMRQHWGLARSLQGGDGVALKHDPSE
jgi:hypothetical protein